MAGFECSTHRRADGVRLDLLASTRHFEFAAADYGLLRAHGIRTVREGIRWHLVEPRPGRYDFSSVLPLLRSAQVGEVQVIWDLFHYGWPNDIDLFSQEFVRRFSALASTFASFVSNESEGPLIVAPVNEISYFAWAAGDAGLIHPCARGRGDELKAQLVSAAIASIEAIWDVVPSARVVHPDPVINVIPDPTRPEDREAAEGFRLAQYQSWDMLSGRREPELGGAPKYLDIIGVNYYPWNQWLYKGETIRRGQPEYRPFREILAEVNSRYGRPMFVSETSSEDIGRRSWFAYVCGETAAAIRAGVELEGVCLYPVLDYPGWDDDRPCATGLWGMADDEGRREIHAPLARELAHQRRVLGRMRPSRASRL